MSKTQQDPVKDFYTQLANLDSSKLDNFRNTFAGKDQAEINRVAADYTAGKPNRTASVRGDTSSIQIEQRDETANQTPEEALRRYSKAEWLDIAKVAKNAELNQLTGDQRVNFVKNFDEKFIQDTSRDPELYGDMVDKTKLRPAIYSRAIAAGWVPPTRENFDKASALPGAIEAVDDPRKAGNSAVKLNGYYSQDPELGQSYWVPLDRHQGSYDPSWALVRNPETGKGSFEFGPSFEGQKVTGRWKASNFPGLGDPTTLRPDELRFPDKSGNLSGQGHQYFRYNEERGTFERKPIGEYGLPVDSNGKPIFTPDPVKFPGYFKA